jgi:hypothetical protein
VIAVSHHLKVLAVGAVLAAYGASSFAGTDSPPDNVAEALAEAARACKDMNGTPNTDAVLKMEDINSDGGEDWIADYGKMKCDGGINPLCSDAGCTIQIYFWDGATSWDVVFEDFVRSYKFAKSSGKPTLHVTTSGLPCNKPVAETCTYNYRLEADTVVPIE